MLNDKIAIFVDGDFWHGRNIQKLSSKLKKSFWKNKITNNKLRDIKVRRSLRRKGWKVIRIWETTLAKNPTSQIARVKKIIKNSQ